MNEKWTIVQVKCKTEFVLTLKQARGPWGCLGNWLPVRWMGKWAWSQQGFVGRWERRQAIGTQHMPHGGSTLIIWQRCWPSSICWEMRRFTTTWHVGSPRTPAFVPCHSWKLRTASSVTINFLLSFVNAVFRPCATWFLTSGLLVVSWDVTALQADTITANKMSNNSLIFDLWSVGVLFTVGLQENIFLNLSLKWQKNAKKIILQSNVMY